MTKLFFFFAGTGDDGDNYAKYKEGNCTFKDDVIRIYIKGCHERQVGNGYVLPDLGIVANHILTAFDEKKLNIKKLKDNLGTGLLRVIPDNDIITGDINEITCEGFSRGAVTALAVALILDILGIWMNIIANQPVTGEVALMQRLFLRYSDLRACKYIKSAHTYLASYDLKQGFLENCFFQQMVPKFNDNVKAQIMLFPFQAHLKWYSRSLIHNHIFKRMLELGLTNESFGCNKTEDFDKFIKVFYETDYYAFTPSKIAQNIMGAEGQIPRDPNYMEWIHESAQAYLKQAYLKLYSVTKLTDEQASAVNALGYLNDSNIDNIDNLENLYQLVLADTDVAKKFIKIINKVTEVCDYLPHAMNADDSDKHSLIKIHAKDYKKAVFLASYAFLTIDKPNTDDKKLFADKIYQAECEFRKNALGIDRSLWRKVMCLLVNFMTHITGVALVVNTINKLKTGNWLFFKHTSSENIVKKRRNAVLREVNELADDNITPRIEK